MKVYKWNKGDVVSMPYYLYLTKCLWPDFIYITKYIYLVIVGLDGRTNSINQRSHYVFITVHPTCVPFLFLIQYGCTSTKAQSCTEKQHLCVFLIEGFSAGVRDEERCYGDYLPIPFSYHPPLYKGPIYFTPKGERRSSRRTIANNGQVTTESIECYVSYQHDCCVEKYQGAQYFCPD